MNYNNFCNIFKKLITVDVRVMNADDCEQLMQDAYVEYKNFIKELYHLTVEEWIEHNYLEFEIETHDLCLSSKLKGLKDLALRNKNKRL